jgi:release factor glutamine methyltransferase
MTIQATYTATYKKLATLYDNSEAQSITRILLEDAFKITNFTADTPFSIHHEAKLQGYIARLLKNEPIQYVLGEADFFGKKYEVSPDVLIPRQETEELVAWIIATIQHEGMAKGKILDIGTGSGCIAIALKLKLGDAFFVEGIDVKSPDMARKNAMSHGVLPTSSFQTIDILNRADWKKLAASRMTIAEKTSYFQNLHLDYCNIFKIDPKKDTKSKAEAEKNIAIWQKMPFDKPLYEVIVSNPPYILADELPSMPKNVTDYEPHIALFVKDDALIFYKTIADFALEYLEKNGFLFFECHEKYAHQVQAMLIEKGFMTTRIRQDIHGKDRMVCAVK